MDLIKVNGQAVGVAEAVRRDMLHENALMNGAIEELVLRQYAQQNGISNSDKEMQVALDEMRYMRGLESAEATNQWLRQNNQTLESVVDGLDYQILRNKIRNSISEDDKRAYFAEHKLEFEGVQLYSIRVESEDVAQELKDQIDEGEDFGVLARGNSQDPDTRAAGGLVGVMTRADVTAEIEAAVFGADVGTVVGPIKTDAGWNLFMVGGVSEPDYNELKDRIQLTLFNELLARLKADAKIEYPVFS